MGGLAINGLSEVLDQSDNPIPGLYAAGEATGGIHGRDRLGGNSLTDALVFGRIAGQNASEYTRDSTHRNFQ
jgi:succinate dehydrogenase/fumarate reductase flavoprotein subunit